MAIDQTIIRNRTYRWSVAVTNKNGSAYDLTGGTLIFTIGTEVPIQLRSDGSGIVITDAVAGEALITLAAQDTVAIPPSGVRVVAYELAFEFYGDVDSLLTGTMEIDTNIAEFDIPLGSNSFQSSAFQTSAFQ